MKMAKLSSKRIIPTLVIGIVLLGVLLVVVDWNEIQNVLKQASWKPLPYAFATTIVSYFCISYSFARVSRLIDIKMRPFDLTAIGFVSTVLNHIMTSGGAAGYSVRFLLMNRQGVRMRDVLAASLLHFYLTSLLMVAMLPVGLIYLIFHSPISRGAAMLLGVLAFVLWFISAMATLLVFGNSIRRRVVSVLTRVARTLLRRDVGPALERFDATMSRGLRAIRGQPLALVFIESLVVLDWVTSAVTLWFCFSAMGVSLGLGELISGFTIGIIAGVISMIPGGFGVQEGSMAGIFALLGIPFDQAVLASVLFRVVYFIAPYVVSLGFYSRLLKVKKVHSFIDTMEDDDACATSDSRIPSHD